MAGFVFSARTQLPTPMSPAFPTAMPTVQDAIPTLPMTPPESVQSTPNLEKSSKSAIKLALHVLSTEKAGLAYVENFYQSNGFAQEALSQAINQITTSSKNGGKLVITGVGKSGKIGQKLEATFKSLGMDTTFLYPTDALHGDLGTIKPVGLTSPQRTKDTGLTLTTERYHSYDIILRHHHRTPGTSTTHLQNYPLDCHDFSYSPFLVSSTHQPTQQSSSPGTDS
jgi:hypothetical protein